MTKDKKRASMKFMWLASAAIALVFIGLGVFVVRVLITDDGHKRKRQIQTVTLLKPPPPPKVKEKPPEPEIKKKEEVIEEKVEEPPEETPDQAESDEPPPGEDLGLDADGGAGSDGFGLRAKKGARGLIGGGLGDGALLRKYGWYTKMLQDEVRRELQRILDRNGGIPGGKLYTTVRIVLDRQGRILKHKIIGSSGNHAMDNAVQEALRGTSLQEPPPEGMPKAIRLKISSQG
jgi:TonB family protein